MLRRLHRRVMDMERKVKIVSEKGEFLCKIKVYQTYYTKGILRKEIPFLLLFNNQNEQMEEELSRVADLFAKQWEPYKAWGSSPPSSEDFYKM